MIFYYVYIFNIKMFTLGDSVKNLCKYIKDNHMYLLPDNWNATYDNCILFIFIKGSNEIEIKVHEDHIFAYTSQGMLEQFIKIFNIPDFHLECCGDSGAYQDSYRFDTKILTDDGYPLYPNLSLFEYHNELDIYEPHARGLILNKSYTECINKLFEDMPNLQYIWIDNVEYTRDGNNCEFDYKLRIASLHYRNELLKNDYSYASRYCIYNRDYSKH